MIHGKRVLAVIPARGGSKRAPRKNLRPFRGIPLLLWSQAAALQSRYIDVLLCSTEDAEIKALAEKHLLTVIDRPPHLSNDTAANEDVLRHALTIAPDHELVVLLQPTSPLRTAEDIDACIEIAYRDNDGCISRREDGSKNGAVYVAWAAWLERGNNFGRPVRGFYVMPDERSLDIDEEWQLAS
jgi:CMP-N,N'-diacetyllegionaminic acid synthase